MSDRIMLPCPLCGSPAELEHGSDHHGSWFNLGCSRHWDRTRPEPACPFNRVWYTADPSDEAAAIEAWNTRPREDVYRSALELFLRQWNACGPNSDFGRYFANVRDAAVAALADAEIAR